MNGTVWLDLSLDAALGDEPWRGLLALNQGIRKNFSLVRNVNIFIEGSPAFHGAFRDFFERNDKRENKSS
jgi:hypothetical protein